MPHPAPLLKRPFEWKDQAYFTARTQNTNVIVLLCYNVRFLIDLPLDPLLN